MRFTLSSGTEQDEGSEEWFPRRKGLRGVGYAGFHTCQVGSEQPLTSCPLTRTLDSLDSHCSLGVDWVGTLQVVQCHPILFTWDLGSGRQSLVSSEVGTRAGLMLLGPPTQR